MRHSLPLPRARHARLLLTWASTTPYLGKPLYGMVAAALPVSAGSGWVQSGSAPPTYASGLSQSAPG
eukprot:scaffold22641_cov42-Phaeocystis_antarctica.AAC.2